MAAISMYRASTPVFTNLLRNLNAILDKAVEQADARKIDHNALLLARLAPDMLTFTRQIQIATDNAKGCVARLAGAESPKYEDNEASFAELKQRIDRTIAFMATIPAAALDGTEAKTIKLKVGPNELEFSGIDYLLNFATMNVYFHVTTAYAILRHNGIAIGKRDFLGNA
jgi:hypothetical protein